MSPALYVIEGPGPWRLATMAHPRGGSRLEADMQGLARAGVRVLVSALTPDEESRLYLTDEPAVARAAGLEFIAFPIADRGLPTPGPMVGLLADRLAADVRAGYFVAIHCWAAIGRSSMLAGATLVRLGLSPDEAWRAISAARRLAVPDNHVQDAWLHEFAAGPPSPDMPAPGDPPRRGPMVRLTKPGPITRLPDPGPFTPLGPPGTLPPGTLPPDAKPGPPEAGLQPTGRPADEHDRPGVRPDA